MANHMLSKEFWEKELQKTRNNREGIGMYAMDSFDDETAECLAYYSRIIAVNTIKGIEAVIKEEKEHYSKEELLEILDSIASSLEKDDLGLDDDREM